MKTKEIKELETKELAERLETEVAKYNQMKFNHNVTPLEERQDRVSLSATKWIKPLLLPLSSRRSTLFMVSSFRKRRNTMHMMRRMSAM